MCEAYSKQKTLNKQLKVILAELKEWLAEEWKEIGGIQLHDLKQYKWLAVGILIASMWLASAFAWMVTNSYHPLCGAFFATSAIVCALIWKHLQE